MRILLYGAGLSGQEYLQTLQERGNEARVIGFIDNNELLHNSEVMGIKVYHPSNIAQLSYDEIVITTNNFTFVKTMLLELEKLDISRNIIRVLAYEKLSEETADPRVVWLKNFAEYAYMKGMNGSIAECGVYQGTFAAYMNKYFYNKQLFLFDTFQGFNSDDVATEIALDNSAFTQSLFAKGDLFASTSVSMVLSKMLYPHNCIIKEGYFPDTAEDIHDIFCFVNLDMDLYAPTLAGLHFFWDKMVEGGILLLHDFFHSELPGVKYAVEVFEKERNILLPKMPIGDFSSIAIIKY